jgi:membrane protease YdiL (CAAX protease family)
MTSFLKVFLYWAIFIILLFMAASQSGAIFSPKIHLFVYTLSGAAIAFMVAWIFISAERKSLADYKLVWQRDTLLKFFKGIAIGVASFLAIVLVLVLFANLEINRNPEAWTAWTLFWYLSIIPAALMEEIAFRSYPFLKLNDAFGLRVTQLTVAVVFALYHVALGWNIVTAFLGPGIWAFVFGIAAIRSNGIALPAGIHVGLNVTLTILGMGGAGHESLFSTSQTESDANAIVGLSTRIVVLLVGVYLTERYIRENRVT